MTENISIQWLHTISLGLAPIEWWESAGHPLITASTTEVSLTVFKAIALIVLALLVFREIAKHRNSGHRLKQKIAELTTTNEKLQQEIADLNGEEIELLEGIIDAKPPKKEIPWYNPQELKALSELAKRLQ
ncbi:MAG: hypothetical protein ACYTDW_06400 [Planctomycetota bacterium]|jgi:hypothetical protein